MPEKNRVLIKRRLNNKPIGVKGQALKDLQKGMTNKDVAAKYGVPKNTLSTWVKNKFKFSKRKERLLRTNRQSNFPLVCWKKSQNIPTDGIIKSLRI